MNRAILIVICDFLVSAMLAMMTGMVPAHTGGTGVGLDENTTRTLLAELDNHRSELEKLRLKMRETIEKLGTSPEREAELRRLAEALAANRHQREQLQAHLNATMANTGKLTPQQLQKELEEERRRRYALELSLRDKEHDLDMTREKLQNASERFKEARRDLAVNRRELSKTRSALEKTSTELVNMSRSKDELSRAKSEVEHKLVQAESKIEIKDLEIKYRDAKLAGAQSQLRNLDQQLQGSKGENRSLHQKLAYTTGQLHSRERNNAELKDALDSKSRQLAVVELERNEARLQRDEMKKTITGAVAELSAARSELTKLAVEKTRVQTKLETTEKFLRDNAVKRSDFIENYSNSIVQIEVKVSEKTMFGTHSGEALSFYPVVAFARGPLVIGTLNRFAGDAKQALRFDRVTNVAVNALAPRDKARKYPLTTPLILLAKNPEVAAFDYPVKDRKPLQLITFDKLRKRGLDDLILFKCTSLGKESTVLDGRCSLSMVPGEYRMFIRNAGRANNELRAEPGDFIISREGEFVGVVTTSESTDGGRVKGAGVLLFADNRGFDNAETIGIQRAPGSEYFKEFAEKMSRLRQRFAADSRRR